MTPHTPVEGLAAEIRELAPSVHTLTNDDLRDTLLAWADRLASLPVEGWRPISEAPVADFVDTQPVPCLVYSPNIGGVRIGRVWRWSTGEAAGSADGYNGDWNITHFRPLPQPPQDQRQGNEQGGTHE